MSQPIWTRWEPTCKLIFVKSLWEHKLLLRLLAVTLIMLIKLGKLNPPLDLLTLQSKILPQLTLQELILVCSCAKILHSTELLVWLGLEQCAKVGLVIMLESMKNEEMSWQLLRLWPTKWVTTWECFTTLIPHMVVQAAHVTELVL